MVSMRDINRDRVRLLVEGNLIPLYNIMRRFKKIKISMRKDYTMKYIAETMICAGMSVEQVGNALRVSVSELKSILKLKYSMQFKNAIQLIRNPLAIWLKGEEYSHEYTITLEMVEYLLIEDFVKAGLETRKITSIIGCSRRRVQRIRKKIMEIEDDR